MIEQSPESADATGSTEQVSVDPADSAPGPEGWTSEDGLDVSESEEATADEVGHVSDQPGAEQTDAEGRGTGPAAPETGDLVIDAALRDLAEAPQDDLDAQVERGEQVQRTLQGRLSDLGG